MSMALSIKGKILNHGPSTPDGLNMAYRVYCSLYQVKTYALLGSKIWKYVFEDGSVINYHANIQRYEIGESL